MAIIKLVPSGNNPTHEEIIRQQIHYITNPASNPHQLYGGYNFVGRNPDEIADQFYTVNNFYKRSNHIPTRHIVLTFDSYYEYFIQPYQVALIADSFCIDMFSDYHQIIFGIHENTSNLHAHIIVNTVSFRDGHLLLWNFDMQNKIYDSLKTILLLNNSWQGTYPIRNLEMYYN